MIHLSPSVRNVSALQIVLGLNSLGGYEVMDLPDLDPVGTRDVFATLAWQQRSCIGPGSAFFHRLLAFPDRDRHAIPVWPLETKDSREAWLAADGRLESPVPVVVLRLFLPLCQPFELGDPCDHVPNPQFSKNV